MRFAVVSGVLAQTVMTSMMSTIALVMHDHGHDWPTVAVSLSAHFLGMFGLVLGGRAAGVSPWSKSIARRGARRPRGGRPDAAGPSRAGMGGPRDVRSRVGMEPGLVAATAILADATAPLERAGLLGFSDFAALATAAAGTILAGVALGTLGLGALVGVRGRLGAQPAGCVRTPTGPRGRSAPRRRVGVVILTFLRRRARGHAPAATRTAAGLRSVRYRGRPRARGGA